MSTLAASSRYAGVTSTIRGRRAAGPRRDGGRGVLSGRPPWSGGVQGENVVRLVEENPTGANDRPIKEVKIIRSGLLENVAETEPAA